MPNKSIVALMEKLESLESDFKEHLKESVGIKVQLNVNTILTGLILTVVIGKMVAEYWK